MADILGIQEKEELVSRKDYKEVPAELEDQVQHRGKWQNSCPFGVEQSKLLLCTVKDSSHPSWLVDTIY